MMWQSRATQLSSWFSIVLCKQCWRSYDLQLLFLKVCLIYLRKCVSWRSLYENQVNLLFCFFMILTILIRCYSKVCFCVHTLHLYYFSYYEMQRFVQLMGVFFLFRMQFPQHLTLHGSMPIHLNLIASFIKRMRVWILKELDKKSTVIIIANTLFMVVFWQIILT